MKEVTRGIRKPLFDTLRDQLMWSLWSKVRSPLGVLSWKFSSRGYFYDLFTPITARKEYCSGAFMQGGVELYMLWSAKLNKRASAYRYVFNVLSTKLEIPAHSSTLAAQSGSFYHCDHATKYRVALAGTPLDPGCPFLLLGVQGFILIAPYLLTSVAESPSNSVPQ